MISAIGLIGVSMGLLAAGFAVGRVRNARSGAVSHGARAARGRTILKIVVAIAAFPVATLMLAKLFNSDVLGWVFGLSLFALAALTPCVAIFWAGLMLGSRGATTRPSKQETAANLVVQVDRGTVHASDDAPSKRISVAPSTKVRAMLATAIADGYLPSISGGRRHGSSNHPVQALSQAPVQTPAPRPAQRCGRLRCAHNNGRTCSS